MSIISNPTVDDEINQVAQEYYNLFGKELIFEDSQAKDIYVDTHTVSKFTSADLDRRFAVKMSAGGQNEIQINVGVIKNQNQKSNANANSKSKITTCNLHQVSLNNDSNNQVTHSCVNRTISVGSVNSVESRGSDESSGNSSQEGENENYMDAFK